MLPTELQNKMAIAVVLAAFAIAFAIALLRSLFRRSHFAHVRGPSSPSWLYGSYQSTGFVFTQLILY